MLHGNNFSSDKLLHIVARITCCLICLIHTECVPFNTETHTPSVIDSTKAAARQKNLTSSPLTNSAITNVNIVYLDHYGVVYPYSEVSWTEDKRLAIRKSLMYFQKLGINTVIQVFSSTMIEKGLQKNWLIFLDEAQRAGIRVVARLYPSNEGNGKEFNYRDIDEFLSIVHGHPALLAYLGLHEPLERFDSKQLQGFYRHIKMIAPDVQVANYMDDMKWYDVNPLFPGRYYSGEICDICIIWYYPAIYKNGVPAFEMDHLQKMVQANRKLVDDRSPYSELWFLGQAYSYDPDGIRMPTREEMEAIFNMASQEGVNGFLWYAWLHDQYDEVLGDPEMEPQQEAVWTIYEKYIMSNR